MYFICHDLNTIKKIFFFLYYKVVTAEKFKKYQGFDLANFGITSLSDIHLYKILMNTSYGVFKENVSKYFNIPPEQVRFWVFECRQNGTVRPDFPLSESYFNTSNIIKKKKNFFFFLFFF
jgi:hypothetical protein